MPLTQPSGGLQDSGSSTGGCRDQSKGQTYVRAAWHNGRFGIMYAWYWPKDQPNDGNVAGGHRHDWENVVVWVDDPGKPSPPLPLPTQTQLTPLLANATPTLIGAAASGHGDYKKTDNPQREGDRPTVEYFTNFPTNHELQFKTSPGKDYPMIDWDVLSEPARSALQNADFGSASVPFKDGSFESNLEKAWI